MLAPDRRPSASFVDLADDLFEQIFDRDDAGGAAMLVHDDCHLRAATSHRRQHLIERHRCRNVRNGTGVGSADTG